MPPPLQPGYPGGIFDPFNLAKVSGDPVLLPNSLHQHTHPFIWYPLMSALPSKVSENGLCSFGI